MIRYRGSPSDGPRIRCDCAAAAAAVLRRRSVRDCQLHFLRHFPRRRRRFHRRRLHYPSLDRVQLQRQAILGCLWRRYPSTGRADDGDDDDAGRDTSRATAAAVAAADSAGVCFNHKLKFYA